MNNQEVCIYFEKNVKEHVNREGKEYVADELVKAGYGQTCGGYFEVVDTMEINRASAEPSQKFHFINYYGQKERNKKNPSYASLHCPQLMLWISEVAGVSSDKLLVAKKIIVEYEEKNKLCGVLNKSGSYLPKEVETKFKKSLEMYKINRIIQKADNWDEVFNEVSQL